MQFPARFADLPEYAFPRLRRLLDGTPPGGPDLAMTIGEPRHPLPEMVGRIVAEHAGEFAKYPPNDGLPELRAAISGWLARRYRVGIDPDTCVFPLNGTREGLFNAALALCPETKRGGRPLVLMPNPFYQPYGAAALAAGAKPVPVPATAETGFLPDYAALPPALLDRVALCYICSPANPQGAVASLGYLKRLLALAERHDFLVLADECYAEIWRDAPPPGAFEAADGIDPERLLVFNSLSKRSNAPGLRSGFVAGDPALMAQLLRLRAYASPVQPMPLMAAATALWQDEAHVEANRALYRAKFDLAQRLLGGRFGFYRPQGGFFLWLDVGDGEAACRRLWREAGIKVLPGAYLSVGGADSPGRPYIRVALVDAPAAVEQALAQIASILSVGTGAGAAP